MKHNRGKARNKLKLRAAAKSGSSSAVSNEVIAYFRRRLFRIFLESAPNLIGTIPALLQKHGITKASLNELVTTCSVGALCQGQR